MPEKDSAQTCPEIIGSYSTPLSITAPALTGPGGYSQGAGGAMRYIDAFWGMNGSGVFHGLRASALDVCRDAWSLIRVERSVMVGFRHGSEIRWLWEWITRFDRIKSNPFRWLYGHHGLVGTGSVWPEGDELIPCYVELFWFL